MERSSLEDGFSSNLESEKEKIKSRSEKLIEFIVNLKDIIAANRPFFHESVFVHVSALERHGLDTFMEAIYKALASLGKDKSTSYSYEKKEFDLERLITQLSSQIRRSVTEPNSDVAQAV